MRIMHNLMADNTHRRYEINNRKVAKSAEKLSSGYRINRAGDDAAGLAISEKMRAQIRGLNMASKNSQDGISLVQTAEGALQEVQNMLHRMNELAVQSATDTNDQKTDRPALQAEFLQLQKEIDQVSETTTFNDMRVFQGTRVVQQGDAPPTNSAFFQLFKGSDVTYSGYMDEPLSKEVMAAMTAKTGANDHGDNPYVSVHIDFGHLIASSGNKINQLADTEFYVNCCTNCCSTVVKFTDGEGVSLNGNTLSVGIQDPATGAPFTSAEAFCEAIVKGCQDTANNISHVEFAYKGTKLYLYDIDNNPWSEASKQLAFFCDNVTPPPTPFVVEENAWIIQTGAEQGQTLPIHIGDMNTDVLGVPQEQVAIDPREAAEDAIEKVREALNKISSQRANLGAMQNRLEHKISNLDNTAENLSAAESRIRDVDMAKEMTEFTKGNILSQASTAILAQANANPQGVLSLLQ